MFFISYLYYYLGSLRVISIFAYLTSLRKFFLKRKSIIDVIIIIYIFGIFILNIFRLDILASSFYIRLFWGYIFFYYYFKNIYINFNSIIFWFSILTVLEFILVHLYPNLTEILWNYRTDEGYANLRDVNGIFTGAHSFGGNRTVSGVLLLSIHIYAVQNKLKYKLLSFVAFICSFSTTAFLLYLFYLLFRLPKALSIILIIASFYFLILLNEIYYRFSFEYVSFIFFEYKLDQINLAIDLLSNNLIYTFFGNMHTKTNSLEVNNFGLNFGDFLLLDFTVLFGISGIIFLVLFFFSKINKFNFFTLIILFLGTVHYHVIFSFPGQILTGYFLSRNKTNF